MGQSLPVILSHSKSVFQEKSEGILMDISAKNGINGLFKSNEKL